MASENFSQHVADIIYETNRKIEKIATIGLIAGLSAFVTLLALSAAEASFPAMYPIFFAILICAAAPTIIMSVRSGLFNMNYPEETTAAYRKHVDEVKKSGKYHFFNHEPQETTQVK